MLHPQHVEAGPAGEQVPLVPSRDEAVGPQQRHPQRGARRMQTADLGDGGIDGVLGVGTVSGQSTAPDHHQTGHRQPDGRARSTSGPRGARLVKVLSTHSAGIGAARCRLSSVRIWPGSDQAGGAADDPVSSPGHHVDHAVPLAQDQAGRGAESATRQHQVNRLGSGRARSVATEGPAALLGSEPARPGRGRPDPARGHQHRAGQRSRPRRPPPLRPLRRRSRTSRRTGVRAAPGRRTPSRSGPR